jgi:HlyD family secretion protein/Putative peptidoglycan binding domain
LVAVAVIAVGVGLYASQQGSATTRPLIVTASVTRRTLQDKVTLTGTLSRLVQRTVTASDAAQISNVSVNDGATVRAGQSIIGVNGREMVAEPGTLPFFRTLGVGDSGPDVRQLDQILAGDGYNPGPISDLFTSQTQSALAQWQSAHGYPGVAADKPETLNVSLEPSQSYRVGPESSAGLIIGPATGTASQADQVSPMGGSSPSSGQTETGAVLTSHFSDSVASKPTTSSGPPPVPPRLTVYALNPVTAKGSPAVFVVYASSTSKVPVDFTVSEGGSAPANEVLPPAGPFTLPPGASSVEVQVPTRLNGLVQPDAVLSLQLQAGSGYTVGSPNLAETTIQSSDVPELNLTGGGNVPAGGTATFTITADQPPLQDTSINFQVVGTAQPGQDFQPLASSVLLPAGQSSVTVPLRTINKNVVFEPTDMITGAWPIRVGQVFVKAGDVVTPGGQLFTLTDPNFTVTLSASPSDRTQLRVGQSVTVQLQGGSAQANGVISQLDDNVTVDATTKAQTYQGKISVGDLGAADGATVSIDVTVQAANNVLSVPIAAVKQNGLGQDVVRVIDLNHGARVSEVPVKTGLADSSYIEIDSGLTEGQVVIVETDKISG